MKHRSKILALAVLVAAVVAWPAGGFARDSDEPSSPAPVNGAAGYKLIGWNDLGMHCMDGTDYSVFAVLPPYNTIHAYLLGPTGNIVTSGFTVTYEAMNAPLPNSTTTTINTTSSAKTNFWKYAFSLGFRSPNGTFLSPDVGLKGYAMPGAHNTPQPMQLNTGFKDNTFIAEGIPITPFADNGQTNPFPMMRLKARNSSGTVVAATDIVLPVSSEMTCSVCHSSSGPSSAAKPARGWVNDLNPLRDVKLNILRKHDDVVRSGLEATALSGRPILCATCHATNALGAPGAPGIPALTASMHRLHAGVVDPVSNRTLDSFSTRDSCYRCHPGPDTKCLRGAMSGAGVQCQDCHGNLSAVAKTNRQGWLNEPTCQSCHTGTATSNSGQIVYASVFTDSAYASVRVAASPVFATNPDTPKAGLSMYRFSAGHGGLQCEACHGSTHAEYGSTVANDNVQSIALQGHAGMISECTACHSSSPLTTNGGPHGLHPIGQAWVGAHPDAAEGGAAQCQACHGADYRGTILSKAQANRTLNAGDYGTRTFARGAVIGCYSCHNGPRP